MQSPELLEQTASERLTLEQEYEMQNNWFQDENSKPDCSELNPLSFLLMYHLPEILWNNKAKHIIVISWKEVKEEGTIKPQNFI